MCSHSFWSHKLPNQQKKFDAIAPKDLHTKVSKNTTAHNIVRMANILGRVFLGINTYTRWNIRTQIVFFSSICTLFRNELWYKPFIYLSCLYGLLLTRESIIPWRVFWTNRYKLTFEYRDYFIYNYCVLLYVISQLSKY